MKNYSFAKMNGAGNDFIILDMSINQEKNITPEEIIGLCNRRRGVGADGVIIYWDGEDTAFNLNFFNADGLPGSLCGNGARCALWFHSRKNNLTGSKVQFRFNEEIYSGIVNSRDEISLDFKPVKKIKTGFKVKAAGQLITAHFADTGSPHVVLESGSVLRDNKIPHKFFDNIEELPVEAIGKEIRHLPEFSPGGVNVNFVSVKDGELFIRTYERGVEEETLACGTGSVAAAIIMSALGKTTPPVHLITRGGDKMIVEFNKKNNEFSDIVLTGPARVSFIGEISKEFNI